MGQRRYLSLGHELETPQVTNDTFRSRKTALDFDVVIWTPRLWTTGYVGSYPHTFEGLPALDADASARLVADIKRRGDEFVAFLELGRTLVVTTPPPISVQVLDKTEFSGTGRNARPTRFYHTESLLTVVPFAVNTVVATGSNIELVASGPFIPFWKEISHSFVYSAYFKQTPGTPLFVIAGTSKAVGSYIEHGGGRVLFVPDLGYSEDADDDEHIETDNSFIDALDELLDALGDADSGELPEWTSLFTVPGERKARDELAKLELRLGKLAEARNSAAAELAQRESIKRLLTETGIPLERRVRAAFEALGAVTEDATPDRTDFILRWGNKTAVVEVKGVGKSAKEQDAAQLEKWVSEEYQKSGKRPKAILVVNGYRDLPLDQRTQAVFPHQMLKYVAAREQCLLSTVQLLGAVVSSQDDAKAKASVLKSIFATSGVYPDFMDWKTFLPSVAEEPA